MLGIIRKLGFIRIHSTSIHSHQQPQTVWKLRGFYFILSPFFCSLARTVNWKRTKKKSVNNENGRKSCLRSIIFAVFFFWSRSATEQFLMTNWLNLAHDSGKFISTLDSTTVAGRIRKRWRGWWEVRIKNFLLIRFAKDGGGSKRVDFSFAVNFQRTF